METVDVALIGDVVQPTHRDLKYDRASSREDQEDVKISSASQPKTFALAFPTPPAPVTTRRPDIDIIRIFLIWGISLFHTVKVYTPHVRWYIHDSVDPRTLNSTMGWTVASTFLEFMTAWNMPLFFFLSGVCAYFALSEKPLGEFRLSRLHRLVVPTLFLMTVTILFHGFEYLAPFPPGCFDSSTNASNSSNASIPYCPIYPSVTRGFNLTLVEYMLALYTVPFPYQAWLCLYLFVYAQILGAIFCKWHPKRKQDGAKWCCCITDADPQKSCQRRLKNLLRGYHLFGRRASTPIELVAATSWWLLGPIKLAILPGLALGVVDMALRQTDVVGLMWLDLANHFRFAFVYIFGFVLTAADEHGFKDLLNKYKWTYFVLGAILLLISASMAGVAPHYYESISFILVRSILCRGWGEWLFMIGLYSVCRSIFKKNYSWLTPLRKIVMPFYLTHQQILVAILSGTLWVEYLGSFPVTLALTTIATLCVSFAITCSGPVAYFFGAPTSRSCFLPGKTLNGMLPTIMLGIILVLLYMTANLVLFFVYDRNVWETFSKYSFT